MKIYACYSPSHAVLVEKYFSPSVPPGFEIVLQKVEQQCPSGSYGQPGWRDAVCSKIEMILGAVERETEDFVASDVDVLFHRLTPGDVFLGDTDVSYALDFPLSKRAGTIHYCAGFAVIRPSLRTRALYDLLLQSARRTGREQRALNVEVLPSLRGAVTVGTLSPDRFWSLPHPIPESYDIAMCHASWVQGVDAKLHFLESVKNLLETFPCS